VAGEAREIMNKILGLVAERFDLLKAFVIRLFAIFMLQGFH
jgi:hypothetical protein